MDCKYQTEDLRQHSISPPTFGDLIWGISWCKRTTMPHSRSSFWTGARPAGSPHRCATPSSSSALLRHRRRAIARNPDAATREQSEVHPDCAASRHCRSIACRVRDRAATGSAGLSSAAQTFSPMQILPAAERNYAPTRLRFPCLAGNPRVCLRSVRKRSRCVKLEHPIPSLDRPDFYRTGLATRPLAATRPKKRVGQLESVNSDR